MAEKRRVEDFPSGHDGKGYIRLNGSIVDAFWIKKVNARIEPIVEDARPLGQRTRQHAQRGINITGDLTYSNPSDEFLKAYRSYKNGGSSPEITLQYYSESSTDEYDRVEVTLTGVILASITMGDLDDTNDNTATHDSTFTANDYDIV